MSDYIERGTVCNDCDNQRICEDKSRCPVGRASAADVVEVKHGRWVVDETDSGEYESYPAYIEFHCPVCNEQYSLESGQYDWFYGDDIPFKFCHECGCKMDGGADNG